LLKIKRFIFFLAILAGFISCEKDWNTLAPWEEKYAVYGTLNLKDTAQYIRINRVFRIEDNPHAYLNNPDSVNIIAEDFEVWMEDLLNGDPAGPLIVLSPAEDYPKDEGLFSTGHYKTFKTTEWLKAGHTYRLFVKHKKTGFIMSAVSTPLGLRTLDHAFHETRYTTVPQYKPEKIDYWGSLLPTQFDRMIQRLLYYEYTDTDTLMKILDWRPWVTKSNSLDSTQQLSDDYLMFIASQIPVKPHVSRKAVGVDKILILNDEELQLFIDLSSEQGSLHFDPGYTNFDRGIGIFASRYYYTFFAMLLKPQTIDTLVYGRYTKDLNFIDSFGNKNTSK
jgi:hypothetical protein